MRCFSCMSTRKRFPSENEGTIPSYNSNHSDPSDGRRQSNCGSSERLRVSMILDDNQKVFNKLSANDARSFSYRELAVATKNFRETHLIGEGGFGKVYKGRLEDGQVVAIKRLNLDGLQGNQEFIVEVLMLSLLHHPNLVSLIGYCAEGEQRLLVYEYMPMGNLAEHLFNVERFKNPMDWNTRIKVAAGAARGLELLHCEAKPPVIYRDLKSANILLDKDFNPKLSDFGLAKLGPVGDKTHVSTRVMGTYGYCAPDYAMSGKLNTKSDIFSFGVVLLELITGKKAFDVTKKAGEQSLVAASKSYLKDRKKYIELVDPRLKGRFPPRSARHLIAVTAMCLNEEASQRPPISEIVKALDFLAEECQSSTATATATSTTTAAAHSRSQSQSSVSNNSPTATSASTSSLTPKTG